MLDIAPKFQRQLNADSRFSDWRSEAFPGHVFPGWEIFISLKNQGYEFEHNFGHGKKNLSNIFAYLMFIAFLFDQLQMLGCDVFQKVLRYCKRKSYMWEDLRSLFRISYILNIVFESWEAFLHKAIGPPKKSESS